MDRLGLGYEALHRRNPRLIYCSISGYGQNGPSRDEAAMDLVVQGSSGLLSITGTEEGESVRCGYGVTDVTAGLFAVIGILLALRAREATGHGQYVDVSMLDSMISTMSSNYMSFLGSGIVPQPMGTSLPDRGPVPRVPDERTAPRHRGGERETLVGILPALDRPDLETASRVRNATPQRIRNRDDARAVAGGHLPEQPVAEWLARLQAAGIPCSLVRNFREVADDPQCAVRGMFPVLDHPTAGPHQVTGTP